MNKDTRSKTEKFVAELKPLAKKYGIIRLSVCGEMNGTFFGLVAIDSESYSEFFEGSLDVARLYQASREKVMSVLTEAGK